MSTGYTHLRRYGNVMQRVGWDHDPIKPWQWATMVGRVKPVEILSFPIPADGDTQADPETATIMVRLTVGDPCTLAEVPLSRVAVFHPSQHEDYTP